MRSGQLRVPRSLWNSFGVDCDTAEKGLSGAEYLFCRSPPSRPRTGTFCPEKLWLTELKLCVVGLLIQSLSKYLLSSSYWPDSALDGMNGGKGGVEIIQRNLVFIPAVM